MAVATAPKSQPKLKLRPLGSRVVVKGLDREEVTKSGIVLPDTAKEKPQEGKVLAVGNGRVDEDGVVHPLDVHKGDRVLFGKYSGSEIRVAGDEHLIIREDDVLAVLE